VTGQGRRGGDARAARKAARAAKARRARHGHGDDRGHGRGNARGKLAIVLDIDETSLSNYSALAATSFKGATAALTTSLFAATSPAIDPTLELFDDARSQKVSVFFITGRPDLQVVRDRTEENLTSAGYSGWKELVLKPSDAPGTRDYKSAARAAIEDDGYRIVLNVGDQDSDLKGGYADKAYKLPNPFYFISD